MSESTYCQLPAHLLVTLLSQSTLRMITLESILFSHYLLAPSSLAVPLLMFIFLIILIMTVSGEILNKSGKQSGFIKWTNVEKIH